MSSLSSLTRLLFRSPLLWGPGLACSFFALIHGGIISNEYVVRYLAGHWVEYIEVGLFCVGLSSLGLKLLTLVGQRRELGLSILPPAPAGGQHPSDAAMLVTDAGLNDHWIPKSLIDPYDLVEQYEEGDEITLNVADWFCKKEGLV